MKVIHKSTHQPEVVWPTIGFYSRWLDLAFGRGAYPMFALRFGKFSRTF